MSSLWVFPIYCGFFVQNVCGPKPPFPQRDRPENTKKVSILSISARQCSSTVRIEKDKGILSICYHSDVFALNFHDRKRVLSILV